MNETAEQVRVTLRDVVDEITVPPFDEMAFRARVRTDRRRRRTAWAAGAAVAACAAAVAVHGVTGVLPGGGVDGADRMATDPGRSMTQLLSRPLYFTAGSRLTAVTPDGTVHDIGMRSEEVVGSTADGVLALDADSRLVRFETRPTEGGDGRFTFARVSSPVEGAVHSVALSEDGRYLAWLGLDERVTVRDLETDEVVQAFEASENSYVASVSDRGVLLSEDGDLVLRSAAGRIPVPTEGDGYGWESDVAGRLVSVVDRDDVTRVYDVSDGSAVLVADVAGSGRLAADGGAVVSMRGEAVRVWTPGGTARLDAVVGRPEAVGWLDEQTAVVTAQVEDGTAVQACDVATRRCGLVQVSERDVLLSD